jgi:hypothetical protein
MEARMSSYETIKANYLNRRKHENDCIAAAKLFCKKLKNGLGWPEEPKVLSAITQVGAEEHLVEGKFAFNRQGKLRCMTQFAIDADSPPATIEFTIERMSPSSWLVIVGGVQHTFDLYGMRMIPDNLAGAFVSVIKRHFEPAYPIHQ